jgi:flagellar hook-associated protein 2
MSSSSGSVSFLGLNSSFDSATLVNQLISLEVQSKINPLQVKKQNLNVEKSFLTGTESSIKSLQSTLKISNIGNGYSEIVPKKVNSSDSSNTYLAVTATEDAVSQSFTVNVSKLASNTVKKSAASVSAGVTGASLLQDIALKGGMTLTNGTVTINGTTQTMTMNTATNTVNNMLGFFNSFAGVTATLEPNGHIKLTGVTSVGSSGDTSNVISALGLNNIAISGGAVEGIQNVNTPKLSTLLSSLGINGTTLTINGSNVTFNPATDTVKTLTDKINDNAGAQVDASYDSLNGKLVLTNKKTGALSITTSSSGSNIITQLGLTSETLGNNAEFTVSNLNGGATIVNNSNTVTGLIEGVTLNLKQVTTGPVSISIQDDSNAYATQVKGILDQVNSIIKKLSADGSSFSRGLISQLKSTMTTYFSGSTNDPFKAGVSIGISSSLDGDNKFSGYTLDETKFTNALTTSTAGVNTLLYGKTGTVVPALDDGSSGLLVKLNDILNSYVDPSVPTAGVISQVVSSVGSQIKSTNDKINKTQASIDAYEARLKSQFAQLDVLNSQMQQQQSALNGLISQLSTSKSQ